MTSNQQKKRVYSSALESIPTFKSWIQRNGEKAHCKFCNVDLRPHRTGLSSLIVLVKKHEFRAGLTIWQTGQSTLGLLVKRALRRLKMRNTKHKMKEIEL